MTDYVKMLNKHLHLDHISLGYAILTFNSKIWMWFLSDEMMIGLYLHNVDYENVYKHLVITLILHHLKAKFRIKPSI